MARALRKGHPEEFARLVRAQGNKALPSALALLTAVRERKLRIAFCDLG